MKFHALQTTKNASRKRAGRGIAAGRGKTAGRGTKGQNARSGGRVRPGFEGGQNPLAQRVPKLPGFTSRRIPAQNVYTGDLARVAQATIDNKTLYEAGLIDTPYRKTKLITKGDVQTAFTVRLAAASQSAIDAITKAGGSFEETSVPRPEKKKPAADKKEE